MGMDEQERQAGLEARITRLEARVASLEGAILGAQPRPATSQPPAPLPPTFVPATPAPTPALAQRQSFPLKAPWLSTSFSELEERLAGRALAVVGGVALVLGAIFFLSLAFSRGWIGPELRVLIGLAAGSAAVAGGAAFLERRNRLLGHVLTPVGLAIVSISLIGATRLYHIAPTEVGLLGSLMSAVIVAMVAIRNESQVVAAFGLVSVLLAPPLLGATADSTTLAFIGVTLVGTTSVALWRSWRWLPPIAFVLTVPQAAAWIVSDPSPPIALVGIGALWALNIVAAGGEEFRRHRDDLSPSSATVLLGNAAFVVWAGFVVLGGDLAIHRGLFLVVLAAAHLAVGGYFVARDGERNLFGLMTLGTGIAALTMAMPIQLGAPAVPIAWTAEAAALAWVAARRGHPYSAAVSAILYGLSAFAVAALYPLGQTAPLGFPFLDGRGGALAFFLGGTALGVRLVRDRSLRAALGAIGLAVAMYCAVATLTGLAFVLAATALVVVAAATIRSMPFLPDRPIDWLVDGLVPRALRDVRWRGPLDLALPGVMLLFGALAAAHLMSIELPLSDFGDVTPPSMPFSDAGAAGAGILIAGVLASGWILGGRAERRTAVLIAGGIAAYAIPFEVYAWAVTVLWVGLGLGAMLIARRDAIASFAFEVAASVAVLGAAFVALGIVAPASRLVVGPVATPLLQMVQSTVSIGAVAVAVASGAVGLWLPERTRRRSTRYAAGILGVYLLSVLAVDIVGARVGGNISLEELRTQGHVVLSILWAVLGVGTFVYGIRSNARDARQGGLAVLAVATIKVFVFDLAALDVAYRVISFIALGLLLLASAWLWQRAQPKAAPAPEPPTPQP